MQIKQLLKTISLMTLIEFTWTPPTTGPAPTGYRLVYGNSSTTKTTTVDVGNVTTKVLDLDYSTAPKYVAVKSYNEFGESAESTTVEVGSPGVPSNFKGRKN